jgi:Ni,Fe-hydrogenase maturation factor
MVGCQPADADTYGQGMSPQVTAAVEAAIDVIHAQLREFSALEALQP